MATENDIVEFQRSAGALRPVAFPPFPKVSDKIKSKFPDLLPDWKQYDEDTKQFVVKLQNILRFGGSSLQLQPITTTPVVTPPVVQPTGPPGPPGPQGLKGEPGLTVIVPPTMDMDDEALVLATVAL